MVPGNRSLRWYSNLQGVAPRRVGHESLGSYEARRGCIREHHASVCDSRDRSSSHVASRRRIRSVRPLSLVLAFGKWERSN